MKAQIVAASHPNEPPAYIYGLMDPNTRRVRYVGQAEIPRQRFREHLREMDSPRGVNEDKRAWLRSLRDAGQEAILIILEEVPNRRQADRRESEWIAVFRQHVPDLLNRQPRGGPSRRRFLPSDKASGEKVATKRIALGLTQQGLADALGISIEHVQRWEEGEYGYSEITSSAFTYLRQAIEKETTCQRRFLNL